MSNVVGETRVTDQHEVTIPVDIRNCLHIEPGDKMRWVTTDEGDLEVDVIHQYRGAFDDLEAISMEGRSVSEHSQMGVDCELRDDES